MPNPKSDWACTLYEAVSRPGVSIDTGVNMVSRGVSVVLTQTVSEGEVTAYTRGTCLSRLCRVSECRACRSVSSVSQPRVKCVESAGVDECSSWHAPRERGPGRDSSRNLWRTAMTEAPAGSTTTVWTHPADDDGCKSAN